MSWLKYCDPLTGPAAVDRVYTDLAVMDITPAGFQLVELAPGVDYEYAAARTGAPLIPMDRSSDS